MVIVRQQRFDDTLRVIDHGLHEILLSGGDEFDSALRHAQAEPFACAAGDQGSDAVDGVMRSPKLVERHFLG